MSKHYLDYAYDLNRLSNNFENKDVKFERIIKAVSSDLLNGNVDWEKYFFELAELVNTYAIEIDELRDTIEYLEDEIETLQEEW